MNGWRPNGTSTNLVELSMYQANGTQCGTTTNIATNSASLTSTNAWTNNPLGGNETGCTVVANDIVTFKVHMSAITGDTVRAGEIRFDYLSSF
jgi:hypothetical protein